MKNWIEYALQWQKNGFPDRETWGLFETIAKFSLPRLIRFKEVMNGHPADMTQEQWLEIIDKMIFAMDYIANDGEIKILDRCPWPDREWDAMWVDDPDHKDYKVYKPNYNEEEEKMIKTFMDESDRVSKLVQEGCELFGKYLWNLWW